MKKEKSRNDGPLERYFAVLETVVAAGGKVTLTEVANMADLPKPTAHRLLNALTEVDVLEVDQHGRKNFSAGPRLWRILQLGINPSRLLRFGQLVCSELSQQLDETSYLVRYDGKKVESIAQEIAPSGHRFHVIPGDILPFHAAATSKVILASQTDEVIDAHLSGDLPKFTDFTKTARINIYAELDDVRKNGFAACDREIDDNVMAYAVPVRMMDQPVIYALGVTGPVVRMGQKDAAEYIGPLKVAAERLALLLTGLQRA
jgi:IclR family acetate operon transcriptional repressor